MIPKLKVTKHRGEYWGFIGLFIFLFLFISSRGEYEDQTWPKEILMSQFGG